MNYTKFAAAIAAPLAALLHAPPILARTAGVALWFFAVDTALGFMCARKAGGATSSSFRTKLKEKVECYFATLGLCAGLAVMAESWGWLIAAWCAICIGEGLSIAENIRGIIARSASPAFAPLGALLDRVDRVLQAIGAQPTGDPATLAPALQEGLKSNPAPDPITAPTAATDSDSVFSAPASADAPASGTPADDTTPATTTTTPTGAPAGPAGPAS